MILGLLEQRGAQQSEQLLKLYWNRAAVKRELRDLRRERYQLLDKLKDHESAIARAKEQLEGLERLLTNPLAAANAMVYFQLRHLWGTAAQRLETFAAELEAQRQKREKAQLQDAEMAKRKRRLDAIDAKLSDLAQKHAAVRDESERLTQRLQRANILFKLLRGPQLKSRITGIGKGRAMLEERIAELKTLAEKIQGEPLPELDGMSVDSRRLVNTAIIAFAQHLVVHFTEHDLASLAKSAMERPVGEMKFGDRAECDRMVERIREKVQELKQHNLPDVVRRRTEALIPVLRYRSETEALPLSEDLDTIDVVVAQAGAPARRESDAPLRVNVIEDDYWDLLSILR